MVLELNLYGKIIPVQSRLAGEEHLSITLGCPTGHGITQHPWVKSGRIPGVGAVHEFLAWLGRMVGSHVKSNKVKT